MKTIWLAGGVTALALALSSCAGCLDRPAGGAGTESRPEQTVTVQTVSAAPTTLATSTTQPATVHAWYEARVFAKTSGYLAELRADIGDSVSEGDVLAVIAVPELAKRREAKLAQITRLEAEERRADAQLAVAGANTESYEAKLAKSQADVARTDAALEAARIELDRVTDLASQRAVAERLVDEAQKKHDAALAEKTAAEAAVTSARAEVALSQAQQTSARANLDVARAATDVARRELEELDELINYAHLRAPFDGVVTQRHVDPGDLVRDAQTGAGRDGTPLFVVTHFDKVRVRVAVPERDAPLLDVGDAVQITLQALPGRTIQGQVSRVAGVLDEQTRTMMAEIDLPNPDAAIRPGMFGQATIVLEPPSGNLSLPAEAVRYDEQGEAYVYVVNAADEIAVVKVQTGLDDGQRIEISAGLTGNERIVGPVLRRLKAGQKVTVES